MNPGSLVSADVSNGGNAVGLAKLEVYTVSIDPRVQEVKVR